MGIGVALLAVAGGVYAFTRGDGEEAARETATTSTEPARPPARPRADIYYLQALGADVRPSGCTARIRFTWQPHYQAERHFGETAVIRVTGPEIAGTYRRPFTRSGVTLEPRPVSLIGGYVIWTAKVVSVGGEPPDNETLVQAANPASDRC